MRKQTGIILCLVFCIMLSGCKTGKEERSTGTYIYYLKTDGNTIERQEYTKSGKNTIEEAKAMLKQLKKTPDSVELISAIPKEVKVEEVQFEDRQLKLHFNENYLKMKKSTEVLCRAAIVQTLVQIDGVDFVSFYVKDEPLKDQKGNLIGFMRAEEFVQNTGRTLSSYQTTTLNLYFANKEGTGLKCERIDNVHYNSNTSLEKLVVEQLMKGPSSGKMNPTIPKVTKLLGVSVKDGICYVNLDSSFLSEGYNQKPEVPIYSIVNSVIENGSVSQVQILIDGASDAVFKESVKLKSPFVWNKDLLEETEKE